MGRVRTDIARLTRNRNKLFDLLKVSTHLVLPPKKRLHWKTRAKLIREGKHAIKGIDRYSIADSYLPRKPGRKNHIRDFGEPYNRNSHLYGIDHYQYRSGRNFVNMNWFKLTKDPICFSSYKVEFYSYISYKKRQSKRIWRAIVYPKTWLRWVKKRKGISRKALKVILLSNKTSNTAGRKPYCRIFIKLPKKRCETRFHKGTHTESGVPLPKKSFKGENAQGKKPYLKHFILSRKKRDELIEKTSPYGPGQVEVFFLPKKRCETRRKALKIILGYKCKKKKVIQKKKTLRYAIYSRCNVRLLLRFI